MVLVKEPRHVVIAIKRGNPDTLRKEVVKRVQPDSEVEYICECGNHNSIIVKFVYDITDVITIFMYHLYME
jgi:hypothetical protein